MMINGSDDVVLTDDEADDANDDADDDPDDDDDVDDRQDLLSPGVTYTLIAGPTSSHRKKLARFNIFGSYVQSFAVFECFYCVCKRIAV